MDLPPTTTEDQPIEANCPVSTRPASPSQERTIPRGDSRRLKPDPGIPSIRDQCMLRSGDNVGRQNLLGERDVYRQGLTL